MASGGPSGRRGLGTGARGGAFEGAVEAAGDALDAAGADSVLDFDLQPTSNDTRARERPTVTELRMEPPRGLNL
jgi:hypothetical protein